MFAYAITPMKYGGWQKTFNPDPVKWWCWAPMRGSFMENEAYCSKGGHYVEFGTRPHQGMRTDLLGLKRLLDEGKQPLELAQNDDHFGVVAKHHKFAETYYDYRRAQLFKKDRSVPNVTVLIGPTGCGKTSWIDQTYGPGNWEKLPTPNGGNWWWTTECCRCDTILIDDVTPKKIPEIGTLLEWTDRYPFKVNIKGGIAEVKPKNIVITSNYPMQEWYPDAKNLDALERRISKRIVFKKPSN